MGSPWSVSLLRHAALPGRQVHPGRALGPGAGRQTISIASPTETAYNQSVKNEYYSHLKGCERK